MPLLEARLRYLAGLDGEEAPVGHGDTARLQLALHKLTVGLVSDGEGEGTGRTHVRTYIRVVHSTGHRLTKRHSVMPKRHSERLEMPLVVGGSGCLELCLFGIRELAQQHRDPNQ